jgi:hypothetical protein
VSSSSLRRAACYAAAGAIILAEFATLAVAANPAVGPEYRAYYLDRSVDCYVAGDPRPALQPGQAADFTRDSPFARCPTLYTGWRKPEPEGPRARGDSAEMRVKLAETVPAGSTVALTLEASSSDQGQRIAVSADGSRLEEFELQQGSNEHRLVLTEAAPDEIRLRFDLLDPGPRKAKKLNFRVKMLQITPSNATEN